MRSEENSNDNNNINQFQRAKTIPIKNHFILSNPIINKFNYQKQKTDSKLKSNSTTKNQLPLLEFNSISFYDSLPSENLYIQDIESLKKRLILNKSNINKKKTELQDLKIQYNKLINENKNHKNLIYEILQLENELNNSSEIDIDNYNFNNNSNPFGRITEEQLISKINSCKITDEQKKKLKDAYELINLRMEINNKKKLLLNKNNEYDKLKFNLKFKNMNEITTKLEDLIIEEKRIKQENIKLEEILHKNNDEILPKLEKDLEKEEKNYEEINQKEKEYKKLFNNKLQQLNELKTEIINIEKNTKSKKTKNILMDGLEYKGAKTISIKLKTKIEKIKIELEKINKYKNEKRDEIANLVTERKKKIDEQKKKNNEIEMKINEISEKNQNLYLKTLEYGEERKKLENRGKEQNKEIRKMKELEDKLNNVTNKKNELIKECEEKEKFSKENEIELNEKNKDVLEQLNNLKNNIKNMNEQIGELNEKINKMQKDNDILQEQIDTKKQEIKILNADNNNENNEEENNQDENKENKKIKENKNKNIEKIQNKKNMLINENDKYKKENEKLNNDINLIEKQIQKYMQMNDKLNEDK